MSRKPRVALTTGDPAGIGPEIARKAAADPRVVQICEPLVYDAEAGVEPVSRSMLTRGENSAQVFRASLGLMRRAIACVHSKRAPASKDTQCTHACRSTPHFAQWVSAAISALCRCPQRAQRNTSRKPGMLGTRGSLGMRGSRGSGGRRAASGRRSPRPAPPVSW